MSSVKLSKISIKELKPGMFVHGIAEQKGRIKIKTQGKVTSQIAINKMRSNGILEVIIDPSKAFVPDGAPEPQAAKVATVEEPAEAAKPLVDFDLELSRAKKLHSRGKAIQKRLLAKIEKGLPFDISIPREFTEQLVGSMDRNPNALLCMTKIREKDAYLLEHSINVAVLLANFAKNMGFCEKQINELAFAGFLHDIGKIRVPDAILHKPGRLSDPEMGVMKEHVAYGVQSLKSMDIPEHIIRTVSEHHERLDGLGYPQGIGADDISMYGRMIAIVDTYDAITADRCYKAGMPSQKALKILLKDAPKKYDQSLVQRFIKCVGIYPVGSLVRLSNERVAMVVEQNPDWPLKPVVKPFYSIRGSHFLEPQNVSLSDSGIQFDIEQGVLASDFGIEFNRFFEEAIAV